MRPPCVRHSNHSSILYSFWVIWRWIISPPSLIYQQELNYRKQIARQLGTLYVEGIHRPKYYTVTLKSLKVTGNGTIGHIIHDLLLVELFHVKYSRDLEMWVRSHSRSLKVVPFESLDMVSYSLSIVTMAVSAAILEIFSVKEWPDLEIWVWVHQGHRKWRGSIDLYDFLLVRHCNYYSSIIVPRVRRSTFGARAFAIAGPTVWNSLPDSLRDPAVGPDQFRRDLKTHLFEWHCVSFSALAVFSRNALYKSTFYFTYYFTLLSCTVCKLFNA